jgi:DNA-binding NarL/FixJ family response regulator
MPSLPRIITVDPTWTIARIARAAMDLMDRAVIQVDVPSGTDALEELSRGGAHMVITALEIGDDMKGFELALRVKQTAPETGVVILADIDDPESLDEETAADSPFVYMHRPVDIQRFLQVILAGLNGENLFTALAAPAAATATVDRGPVPAMDKNKSQQILDTLLHDVGGMAVVLADRNGEVLMERGAVGFLNRIQLTTALIPTVNTTIEMGDLIGGQPNVVQFFDGEDKDVFVFSVGLHHFLCVVFDGQAGARQFGIVNRYGRKAAEDLIALLGANAFIIEKARPVVKEEAAPAPTRPGKKGKRATEEAEKIEPIIERVTEPKVPEPEPLKLDPIENLDVDIFKQLANLDESEADDLFDPEKLAEIAEQQALSKKGGPISRDVAEELGIIPDLGKGGD